MKLTNVSFIASATSLHDSIDDVLSEVVFIGRSNVGKSTLINLLSNKKDLAKSSSTPGKTKLINFFTVLLKDENNNYSLRWVDMPGFGYAKVSKATKKDWEYKLDEFLRKRQSIRVFVHLVDSRHFDLQSDIEVGEYLNLIKRADQSVLTVFTKIDKLNQSQKSKLDSFVKNNKFDNYVYSSLSDKQNIQKVLGAIINLVFGREDD